MVNETVFWGVALGLESAEKSLLGTENLNGGCWVLGEVGEGSSVGDEAGSDDLADKLGQVRRDDGHLIGKVLEEGAAVLGELDDAVGEHGDVLHVLLGEILTHRDLAGINNGLGNVGIVVDNGGDVVELIVRESALVTNRKGELGVGVVVIDNLDKLWEVPSVPLANAHGEGVDGLVEVVESRNSLDDVVVVLLDGELDLCAGVGVTKTKLCSLDISIMEALQQLSSVQTEASQKIANNLRGIGGLALHRWEVGLDATGQVLVLNTEDNLLLLADLWEVKLKHGAEVLGKNTLRHHVDVLEGLSGSPVHTVSANVSPPIRTLSKCTCMARS